MKAIDLILSPNLQTSSMKTAQLLMESGGEYRVLLLNFPEEMEGAIMDLNSNLIAFDEFIDEVRARKIIPEPEGAWEYAAKPILKSLPQLAKKFPSLKFFCYGSKEDEFNHMEVAMKETLLILRTTLTGKVEINSWRETLRSSLDFYREATLSEAEKIIRKVGEKSICISDMGGRFLEKVLSSAGFKAKILYIEKPYHFTPLMILTRKMVLGKIEDRELEELIRSHIEYIRNYIYKYKNRDRAHYEWEYDKIPWLRGRLNKEELRLLDALIE